MPSPQGAKKHKSLDFSEFLSPAKFPGFRLPNKGDIIRYSSYIKSTQGKVGCFMSEYGPDTL